MRKFSKNIKTHFISSNKYFIKHNIYPKRNKMRHILKPEKKESPYYIIQVSQVRELIEVKEVITPYGRSGSEEPIVF